MARVAGTRYGTRNVGFSSEGGSASKISLGFSG